MQKGLGIAALVFSILAIFMPFGMWLTVVVALLAMFAYGEGFGFGVAAIVINLINLLFLSPFIWIYFTTIAILPIILIGVQIIALIFLIKKNKGLTVDAPSK